MCECRCSLAEQRACRASDAEGGAGKYHCKRSREDVNGQSSSGYHGGVYIGLDLGQQLPQFNLLALNSIWPRGRVHSLPIRAGALRGVPLTCQISQMLPMPLGTSGDAVRSLGMKEDRGLGGGGRSERASFAVLYTSAYCSSCGALLGKKEQRSFVTPPARRDH